MCARGSIGVGPWSGGRLLVRGMSPSKGMSSWAKLGFVGINSS
jgi:hypothetical protein